MLQATLKPALAAPFVERALSRFPEEPRFLLARAIVSDQRTIVAAPPAPPTRLSQAGNRTSVPPINTDEIIALYETAATHAPTRAEALMRLGWLLHRLKRDEEALARLKEAASAETSDWHVRYLRDLLTGQVLMSLTRQGEAIDFFRRAMATVPGAQSARVALMTALTLSGNRDGSEALAESIQAASSVAIDPWWMYWQGLYREYPDATRRLRDMTR
jgi:tetratricopeptide (TPR) repeat protein